VEWEKIRAEREAAAVKESAEKLKQLALDPNLGKGEPIPLITSIPAGRDISDVYLKHPANESSEDEEGEEVPAAAVGGKWNLRCLTGPYLVFYQHQSMRYAKHMIEISSLYLASYEPMRIS